MAEQAAQCGYCVSGMIMSAKALLDRNPQPSAAEVRRGLAGNLCRCGTHNRFVRAVMRAAQAGGRI
jgi:nicotinate dehydrogenase subunit A